MIKAVFFDIDGTLISFKTHHVPESTISALQKLKDKGVKIFISTGRAPRGLGYLKKVIPLEFDGYLTVNGQYCYIGDKVIRECTIPTENIVQFLPYLERNDISCVFVERDYSYINRANSRVSDVLAALGNSVVEYPIDSTNRIFENKVYQLCPFVLETEEAEAVKYLPGCRPARWHPLFTDVIPADGGKGAGIRAVLEYCGIDISESMAFGDGGNDIEMLKTAGIGVAMGAAPDHVKAAADHVTADVDDDGIYLALKKFKVI